MLSYLYFTVVAAGVLIGMLRWRKLFPRETKVFVIYLAIVLAIEIIGHIMRKVMQVNNTGLYNAYIIIHLFFISLIFIRAVDTPATRVANIVLLVLAILAITVLWKKNINGFQSDSYLACLVFTMVTCLVYFLDLLLRLKAEPLSKNGLFWIASGLIIHSVLLIFFLGPFRETFNTYEKFGIQMKTILQVSNILSYSIFGVGLFLCTTSR